MGNKGILEQIKDSKPQYSELTVEILEEAFSELLCGKMSEKEKETQFIGHVSHGWYSIGEGAYVNAAEFVKFQEKMRKQAKVKFDGNI